jgi:hypothetical protein
MRNALYKSIIRQDMSFFDKHTAGELNSALIGYEYIFKVSLTLSNKISKNLF